MQIESLIFNLLGYSTVFLPGYLIIRYVRESGYLDRGPAKCLEGLIRAFVQGSEDSIDDAISKEDRQKKEGEAKKSEFANMVTLVWCFVGLQVSYLTWGFLQEKIMTQTYSDWNGEKGQFADSQFLVFVNRILAFAIAVLYITFTRYFDTLAVNCRHTIISTCLFNLISDNLGIAHLCSSIPTVPSPTS